MSDHTKVVLAFSAAANGYISLMQSGGVAITHGVLAVVSLGVFMLMAMEDR
jgi:hypothetical protein